MSSNMEHTVMSSERSSSAVRNLRSIFENKESESNFTDTQQPRATSRETSREGRRPLSKVRSSFVVVEQLPRMASTSENEAPVVDETAELTRESSASLRRPSIHENAEDSDQLAALKKIVSQESERREEDPSVAETIPEAAVESAPATPKLEFRKGMALAPETAERLASVTTTESTANPDKPVTSADEEEPGTLQPAEPTNAAAISGEDEATPVPEEAPTATVPLKKVSKLPSIPKSSASANPAPVRELNRKVSRSSLTAPTAASVARSSEKRESLAHKTTTAAPRLRESTKPLNVSSHLLAPTAASRARQEQEKPAAKAPAASRAPTKSTTASRPARASLASSSRPSSQGSEPAKKSAPSGSFLDRLTKPTAASQHRAQEKYEAKSPRKSLPLHRKPLTNGSTKSGDISSLPEEDAESILDPSTPTKASAEDA